MPSKQATSVWWTSGGNARQADAQHYNELAEWCERLDPAEQRRGFERILGEMTDSGDHGAGTRKDTALQWVSSLAESGAFESAAIALIPRSATFTGGRMKDGAFVAQVIPEGSAGAHSRNAQSLSMAWLAALLRALARQSIEVQATPPH